MKIKYARVGENPCPTDRAVMSAQWRRIERKFEADIERTMREVDSYEDEIRAFFEAKPDGFRGFLDA